MLTKLLFDLDPKPNVFSEYNRSILNLLTEIIVFFLLFLDQFLKKKT